MIFFLLNVIIRVGKLHSYIFFPYNLEKGTVTLRINDRAEEVEMAIDTMSFQTFIYSGFLNETEPQFRREISGRTSYRDFSGYENYIWFENIGNKNFSTISNKLPVVEIENDFIIEEDGINFSRRNAHGILGLAKNYTSDMIIEDTYYFGSRISYSIVEYFIKNKIIEENVFSIYKDGFFLGKVETENEKYSSKSFCKPDNFLVDGFEYFFWNCQMSEILINNLEVESRGGYTLLYNSLLNGLMFPKNLKNSLLFTLNEALKSNCTTNDLQVQCSKNKDSHKNIVDSEIKIVFFGNGLIKIPLKNLLFECGESYCFNIFFNQYTRVIHVGKVIFKNYFIEFNNNLNLISFFEMNFVKIKEIERKKNFGKIKYLYLSNIGISLISIILLNIFKAELNNNFIFSKN